MTGKPQRLGRSRCLLGHSQGNQIGPPAEPQFRQAGLAGDHWSIRGMGQDQCLACLLDDTVRGA